MTIRGLIDQTKLLIPADTHGAARVSALLKGMAVLSLLRFNSWAIARFGGDLPARWSPGVLPWGRQVEAAWPVIHEEVLQYLSEVEMPHTAELAGLDPDSQAGQAAAPVEGAWRTVVLEFFGKPIAENAEHFPRTMELLESVEGVTSIAFTGLDPRSHIESHVGPNKGALRYQLPVTTPGPPGACRIRVGDEMIIWQAGRAVLFDLSVDHEAWNDSDGVRILLMIEVPTPLPAPLRWLNRLAQASYRFHPSYQELPKRAVKLARQRSTDAAPSGSDSVVA